MSYYIPVTTKKNTISLEVKYPIGTAVYLRDPIEKTVYTKVTIMALNLRVINNGATCKYDLSIKNKYGREGNKWNINVQHITTDASVKDEWVAKFTEEVLNQEHKYKNNIIEKDDRVYYKNKEYRVIELLTDNLQNAVIKHEDWDEGREEVLVANIKDLKLVINVIN